MLDYRSVVDFSRQPTDLETLYVRYPLFLNGGSKEQNVTTLVMRGPTNISKPDFLARKSIIPVWDDHGETCHENATWSPPRKKSGKIFHQSPTLQEKHWRPDTPL